MGNTLTILLQSSLLTALLTAASAWDIRKRIIPDFLCFFIAMTALFDFTPEKLCGLFASIILLIAALAWGGIGGGDVKLMAACGLVLGFYKSMAALVMGLVLLLLFHIVYALVQKVQGRNASKAYPLAPFLSLGCFTTYFYF